MASTVLSTALRRFIGTIDGKKALTEGCIHNHVEALNYLSTQRLDGESHDGDILYLSGFVATLREHYNIRQIGPHEEYYVSHYGRIKIRPVKEFLEGSDESES